MFKPPRCPYESCKRHADPGDDFFTLHGSYKPRCRPRPVPRFRCRGCSRTFSRQTFRADYCDHKPHLNARLVELLTSGVGLRQSGRLLSLSLRCVELKARKLARHAQRLDTNLQRTPTARGAAQKMSELCLHFDEFETFEGRRNTRPLTIAVAIETESRFLLGARSAPIRAGGTKTKARLEALAADEERFGKRPNRSRAATRWAFRRAEEAFPGVPRVVLRTDLKTTYHALAKDVFEGRELEHLQTPSVLPRDKRNPLFPINHTEACLRDLNGRLRRESWLVSKARWFLNVHLSLYSAWRNWVRPRFNDDERSPGEILGWIGRRLRPSELLGWRQDWRGRSPHPLGDGRRVMGGPVDERTAAPRVFDPEDEPLPVYRIVGL